MNKKIINSAIATIALAIGYILGSTNDSFLTIITVSAVLIYLGVSLYRDYQAGIL